MRVLWTRSNLALLCQHDSAATGTAISEGGIDLQSFFWDPLSPGSRDPDVKLLISIGVV
jgi:methylglyoxal synthase